MRDWKTTLIGLGEAIFIELTAEALFNLTWKERAMVITIGALRASFGYFARDRKAVEPPK